MERWKRRNVATGLWYPVNGMKLNPMFAAAAMSLSSFCVVTNALRLNFFRLYQPGRRERKAVAEYRADMDVTINVEDQKEDNTMTKTLHVEGMMCGHCEARVKKVLEALPEVTEAAVSHESGTAVVTLSAEVSDEVLKKTVEEQDYKVAAIE